MDLVHETTSPLAWDHEQMPFQLPSEAVAWKVRVFTGKPGRPPAVYGEQGVLHLALDATVEDLRRAVDNDAGSYRLYPVDMNGKELTPIGCMEIVAQKQPVTALDVMQPDATATTAAMREMVLLCDKMVASRDSHDALLANVLNTLVSTTATIQRSTAAVLNAASTTIKVANGVESLERQEPQLDVNQLTEHLVEALEPAETPSKPGTPWYVQLLGSPVGMGILNNVNSFFSTLRENAVNKQTPQMPQPATPAQTAPQSQAQPVQALAVQAPPPAQSEPVPTVDKAARPAPRRAETPAGVRDGASQNHATRADGTRVKKRPARIDDDEWEDRTGEDTYDEDRAVDLDGAEQDGGGEPVDQDDLESDDSGARGEAEQVGAERVGAERVEVDPGVEQVADSAEQGHSVARHALFESSPPDVAIGSEQDQARPESAPLPSDGVQQVHGEAQSATLTSTELPEREPAECVSGSAAHSANYTAPPWANDGERDGPAR